MTLSEKEAFDLIDECLRLHGYYQEKKHYRIKHNAINCFNIQFCPNKIHRVFDIDIFYDIIGKANIRDFKIRINHQAQRVHIIMQLEVEEDA